MKLGVPETFLILIQVLLGYAGMHILPRGMCNYGQPNMVYCILFIGEINAIILYLVFVAFYWSRANHMRVKKI